jgi:hypothetical protein
VCVEWAQARARAARWSEEVTLLVEEMRRVLHFLMWRKQWWQRQGEEREDARADVKEGLRAYAVRQGLIVGRLAGKFADEWHPLLVHRNLPTEWPEELRTGERYGSGKRREQGDEGEDGMDDTVDEVFDDMF